VSGPADSSSGVCPAVTESMGWLMVLPCTGASAGYGKEAQGSGPGPGKGSGQRGAERNGDDQRPWRGISSRQNNQWW
jgi:hypothetical protein